MTPEPTDADVERVGKALFNTLKASIDVLSGETSAPWELQGSGSRMSWSGYAEVTLTAYDSPYVAALNELREMHRPSANKDPEYCVDCSDSMGEDTVLWPCPTRRVIERVLGQGGGE